MSSHTERVNAQRQPVVDGRIVSATGTLHRTGDIVQLRPVGSGHYDRVLRDADVSVEVELLSDFVSTEPVTVAGSWVDGRIVRARIIPPRPLVATPKHLGTHIDPELVPKGRVSREVLQSGGVSNARAHLAEQDLFFLGSHRLDDGWIGVACASDVVAARNVLSPLIGDALTVVPARWTKRDLRAFQDALSGPAEISPPLFIGQLMNPSGELQACGLVTLITSDLADRLAALPLNSYQLDSWIQAEH